MKRHLLLVAIAGCVATPVAAEDSPRPARYAHSPAASSPGSELDAIGEVAPLNGDADTPAADANTENEPILRAAFALDEVANEPASGDDEGQAPAKDEKERFFHPVRDCGCSTPCLDCWHAYDVTCCGAPCTSNSCWCSHGNCYLVDGCWVSNDARCDVWGPPVYRSDAAMRFGWWAVGTDGSENKTGEFQDLDSSPFFDIDTISSDGVRTWDVVLSGLDNEANDAHFGYYSPGLSGKLDFQRYLRRWDHDPVMGLDLAPGQVPPAGAEGNVIAEDLNVGQDYAIRVQEIEAKFQRRINDNLKWRMNVWSQRKFGERQSNATAHCFNVTGTLPVPATGNVCHVLSERQTIDWVTVEVQPVIEAKFENVAVEYSRTMRSFGQDDQVIDRQYSRFNFSPASGELGPGFNYALVPENFTQIDRLKVSACLNQYNDLFANMYLGDTKNDFRETHRSFGGYDIRLTNSLIEDVKLTGYTSMYEENNDFPPFFLIATLRAGQHLRPGRTPPPGRLQAELRAGLKSSWQPFGDRGPRCSNYGLWDGTSLASGYEYYQLEREYAVYPTALGDFAQPHTKTHQIEFGPSTRWSRSLDTYIRYKVRFIEDPLIGVREFSGGFNTNQPEEVHLTEIGWTWTPAVNFMTSTQFSFINSWHESEFADFTENDYPIVFTAWYAPTHRLSFTGGYAYFSNWIDQDITLGFTTPNVPVPPVRTETTRWNYSGENHQFSINANYAWSPCVQLVGGYEYNRGSNVFDVPPSPAGADWSLLPFIADVIVETQRLTAGVDWQPYRNTDVYLRYIYSDWDDISSGLYTGTAHMALAGATRTW